MDFPLPLPQAIIMRASLLFIFLGHGESGTIQFLANCKPSTDLMYLYREPFAPRLADPFVVQTRRTDNHKNFETLVNFFLNFIQKRGYKIVKCDKIR